MKLTNLSARVYYVDGIQIIPGETAEVDDKWKDNKSIQAAVEKGELRIEQEPELSKKPEKPQEPQETTTDPEEDTGGVRIKAGDIDLDVLQNNPPKKNAKGK